MNFSEAVVVLTTVPDLERAEQIGRMLVDERLAACVNVHGPMMSFYRWKGALERDEERQLVIKTTHARVDAVRRRIAEVHPYELPEFLVLPVAGGSEVYLEWLARSTSSD